ncbi:hypothetical protein C8J56DRAFT_891404 [Mycena floridula]|nr:hypothetical protein C8J56DRAFT_891404 [Mycena floridula]
MTDDPSSRYSGPLPRLLRARLDEGGFPAPAETGVAGKAPMMDKESTEVLNEAKKLTVKVAANVARLNRLRDSNNKLVDEVHTLRDAIKESKASYTALEKDHRSLLKDHSALQKAHDSLRESSLEKNKALEKRVDTMDSTLRMLVNKAEESPTNNNSREHKRQRTSYGSRVPIYDADEDDIRQLDDELPKVQRETRSRHGPDDSLPSISASHISSTRASSSSRRSDAPGTAPIVIRLRDNEKWSVRVGAVAWGENPSAELRALIEQVARFTGEALPPPKTKLVEGDSSGQWVLASFNMAAEAKAFARAWYRCRHQIKGHGWTKVEVLLNFS